LLGAIVQAPTRWAAMTTLERADTLCRIWGVTCASCACSVVGLGELLSGELLCGAGCCWAAPLPPPAAWLPWWPSSTVAAPAPMPAITATTTVAMSQPRRRLGGADRRGGGDTNPRGGDEADGCGGDASGHGGDDANGCGADGDGHGGDDADSCGADGDAHDGGDADGHGCAGGGQDWAGAEGHGGGVDSSGGGANCGGGGAGCPGGEGTPSHAAAVGCQPESGSGDGKSAVGHCSAVTSAPQETQNRTDSSGRGCPHDGHQRTTVPPKSAPLGRLPSGARYGTAAGVTGHRSPAFVPAPGGYSPPEQDSPL